MNLPRLRSVHALILCVSLLASPLGAQVTTNRASSILFFPRLVTGNGREAIVTVANISNNAVRVRCFYVAASGSPQSAAEITPFSLFLIKQQPTHWTVSRGRAVDPDDDCVQGDQVVKDCDGAGTDPGTVPPKPDFRGSMICIETDFSGAPLSGNHLTGDATSFGSQSAQVSKYSAIGLVGNENNDGDSALNLGGLFAESDACYSQATITHFAEGSVQIVGASRAVTRTTFTVVPCTQDLTSGDFEPFDLSFAIRNQSGEVRSTIATAEGWTEIPLASLPTFSSNVQGNGPLQTTVTSTVGFLLLADIAYESLDHPSIVKPLVTLPHGLNQAVDVIRVPDP